MLLISPVLCLFQASPLQSRSLLEVLTRVQCSRMGRQCAGVKEVMEDWEMALLQIKTVLCLFQSSKMQYRSLLAAPTRVQPSQMGKQGAGVKV